MPTPMEFFLTILQGLWAFWPLIFLAALEGSQGWRTRNKAESIILLKKILRNLLIGWLAFFVLWVVIFLVKRAPMSFIIPETLNYSFFWLVGMVLLGLEAFIFIINRVQTMEPEASTTGLDDLLALTPYEFEQLTAETYQAFGYRVHIVSAQGNPGINLVLQSSKGERSVVQCKCMKGDIGEPAVHDFYRAMQHEGAAEGAIITTGTFSPQAREWAKDKPIHLYDGKQFLNVLHRAQNLG
jgi:hypothetical protein